jgi:flavin reductase (DIM6/NTAB) family NADH-FMN oxidoreductase RutF
MQTIDRQTAVTLASPFPYVLATTVNAEGKPNAIGLAWWTFVSGSPPMLAISVGPGRYSHDNLEACGEFVLCFPSAELAKPAWKAGRASGRKFDKFGEGGLVAVPAKHVKPPIVEGSTAAFECKVVNTVTAGDHTIFIADVVEAHGSPDKVVHLYSIHYTRLVAIGSDGTAVFDLKHE